MGAMNADNQLIDSKMNNEVVRWGEKMAWPDLPSTRATSTVAG